MCPMEFREKPVPLEVNTSIWRYVDALAAIHTLSYSQLRLTQVNQLDDKWEGRIGPASRRDQDALNAALAEHSGIPNIPMPYAQIESLNRFCNYISSWTENSPSDMVMWLAYTNSHESVAMETTVGALGECLVKDPDIGSIGAVIYRDVEIEPASSLNWREELYGKRLAFGFEREVRLSVDYTFTKDGKTEWHEWPSHQFEQIKSGTIKSLILHPRASKELENLLHFLSEKLLWSVRIERSSIAVNPPI